MSEKTTCVIAGGGPAGMVLGLLLARAGIEVRVLEKHGDFLRDFRGDTVHPSTLRLLDELGLFERFDALPHSKLEKAGFDINGRRVDFVDFHWLRDEPHPYIAMVPQWDLLNLLAAAGEAEPTYTLSMNTSVTGLLRDETGRVTGVRVNGPDGPGEIHSDLVVGCDGRWSTVRREAHLIPREYPVGHDIWWFKIPNATAGETMVVPRTAPGMSVVCLPREGYAQVGLMGVKGTDAALRANGIDAFRRDLVALIPEFATSIDALTSMDDIKCLDIRLNRLKKWHIEGLLCIGDAAHAMSPAGGIGINMAIQDAVAAARILPASLRRHQVSGRDLDAVRRRREFPVRVTQTVQRVLHKYFIGPMVDGKTAGPPKAVVTVFRYIPRVSALPTKLLGVGVRPERAPAYARRQPNATGDPAAPNPAVPNSAVPNPAVPNSAVPKSAVSKTT